MWVSKKNTFVDQTVVRQHIPHFFIKFRAIKTAHHLINILHDMLTDPARELKISYEISQRKE